MKIENEKCKINNAINAVGSALPMPTLRHWLNHAINAVGAAFCRPRAVKMTAPTIVIMLLLLLLTGCAEDSESTVILAGSTSVQPYAEMLAEEYSKVRPDKIVEIQGGGSSAGIMAVESGIAHIGMSSRNLKEAEWYLWKAEIAKDGLAIIVHPENKTNDLTRAQLRSIYTGEITNWKDLGGEDARIHIIAREEGSGTRSAFEELVMGDERITPRAIVQNSNGAVRQLVSGDKNSIGFISLGLVDIGEQPVKAIAINGVSATREHVMDGSYMLFRSFLFVSDGEPQGPVREFYDYVISDKGQNILIHEGLVEGAGEDMGELDD